MYNLICLLTILFASIAGGAISKLKDNTLCMILFALIIIASSLIILFKYIIKENRHESKKHS